MLKVYILLIYSFPYIKTSDGVGVSPDIIRLNQYINICICCLTSACTLLQTGRLENWGHRTAQCLEIY